LVAASAPGAARADAKIYRKLLPSTAFILTKDGAGSGVLIDHKNRLLVTNEHVVDGVDDVTVFFPDFKNGRAIVDEEHYHDNIDRLGIKGRVLIVDAKRDVALIELERVPEGVAAVPLASDSPFPGETVHSIGSPGVSHAMWSYTSGSIRAVYRKKFNARKPRDMVVVETQSPINPGDSGGPVVNADGELVAISQSFSAQARLVTNSVDVSEIRAVLAEKRAWQELLTSARLKVVRETARSYGVETTANGGTQTVFIAKSADPSGKLQTRQVFAAAITVEGPLSSEAATKLQEQNARSKKGTWTVESTANGKTVIFFSVSADASSPNTLAAAVDYVAKMAGGFKL
jgi:S1-C subfamily serine protease